MISIAFNQKDVSLLINLICKFGTNTGKMKRFPPFSDVVNQSISQSNQLSDWGATF